MVLVEALTNRAFIAGITVGLTIAVVWWAGILIVRWNKTLVLGRSPGGRSAELRYCKKKKGAVVWKLDKESALAVPPADTDFGKFGFLTTPLIYVDLDAKRGTTGPTQTVDPAPGPEYTGPEYEEGHELHVPNAQKTFALLGDDAIDRVKRGSMLNLEKIAPYAVIIVLIVMAALFTTTIVSLKIWQAMN